MPLKLIPPRPDKTPYWSVRGTYLMWTEARKLLGDQSPRRSSPNGSATLKKERSAYRAKRHSFQQQ